MGRRVRKLLRINSLDIHLAMPQAQDRADAIGVEALGWDSTGVPRVLNLPFEQNPMLRHPIRYNESDTNQVIQE